MNAEDHAPQADALPQATTADLHRAAAENVPTKPDGGVKEGTQIGRYKCLQKLGEGAMGVVFMAEQVEPVRRRVALKVVKPGMDSEQVLARFDAERQALAMMNHDHIARVFDAGTTESGRPYFVMELVKGVPLTTYCNDEHVPIRQRLELFIAICHAVQHAHQKGIIHRDLKPSNVLVALVDGQPIPKVIDFGLAKAFLQPLTERTMFTNFGAILGTLEYMSPEQADMSALDIDTRTDIYSLGVLLYELLTGTTPLAHAKLREKGYSEIVRLIHEVEPQRPSSQLSNSGERLGTIAVQRNTDPVAVCKLVRGDLDWIVMKALEKNRARRYPTASELAADIERYLKHEPITARPPSVSYQLRKFFQRNRGPALAVSMFLVLLIAAAVVSTWLAVRATVAESEARNDRDRAKSAEEQAKADKERAQSAEKKAEKEANEAEKSAAIAKAFNEFLIQDVLAQANPLNQSGPNQKPDPNLALRTVLDRAAAKIPGRFPDQPLVEAAIRKTIGETYLDLGVDPPALLHLEAAVELYRKHRGEMHPDTIDAMTKLSSVYWQLSKYAAAVEIDNKLLAYCQRELGDNDQKTLEVLNSLGLLYLGQEKFDQAEAFLLKAYNGRRKYLGEEDGDTLNSLNCLGWFYYDGVNHYEQAEPFYVKALELRRKRLPEKHIYIQHSVRSLAMLYHALGRYDAAEPLYREALDISQQTLGEESGETLSALMSLGEFLADRGQLEEAERHLRKALKVSTQVYGDNYVTRAAIRELAEFLLLKGETVEALALSRRYHAITLTTSDETPLYLANAKVLLAKVLLARGQFPEAETELAKSLAAHVKHAPDRWMRYSVASRLGEALARQKKFAEAEPLLLQAYDGLIQYSVTIPAPQKNRIQQTGEQLVLLYEAWEKPDKANEWRKRLSEKK